MLWFMNGFELVPVVGIGQWCKEKWLLQMLLKIRSFHAEDNPFERPAGSLDGEYLYETWSLASQQPRPFAGSSENLKDS